MDFLIFTIYAPLASWGDIAVGELRGSWDRPSRSAILGMIAAALGLERDNQDAHDALDAGYGVAVRLDLAGSPMEDYHTAQTVAASAVKKQRPTTRRQLLAPRDRPTILSRRTYRQDALATGCIWQRDGARWTLDEIAAALRSPVFALYAGRKSNVLGLPLAPKKVAAATLAAAFSESAPLRSELREFSRLQPRGNVASHSAPPEIAHDHCDGFDSGLHTLRREVRRDAAANRLRWQFSERTVEIGTTGGDS
jgi:CRISPR system Cascade subunit CasD